MALDRNANCSFIERLGWKSACASGMYFSCINTLINRELIIRSMILQSTDVSDIGR